MTTRATASTVRSTVPPGAPVESVTAARVWWNTSLGTRALWLGQLHFREHRLHAAVVDLLTVRVRPRDEAEVVVGDDDQLR